MNNDSEYNILYKKYKVELQLLLLRISENKSGIFTETAREVAQRVLDEKKQKDRKDDLPFFLIAVGAFLVTAPGAVFLFYEGIAFFGVVLAVAAVVSLYEMINFFRDRGSIEKRFGNDKLIVQHCVDYMQKIQNESVTFVEKVSEVAEDINENNYIDRINDLKIINESFGILEEGVRIDRAYALGVQTKKDRIRSEEIKKENKIIIDNQKKQQQYINSLDKKNNNQIYVSSLVGKDKYLDIFKRRLKEIQEKKRELQRAKDSMAKLGGIMAASGLNMNQKKNQGLDWKTSALAGAASAIGGPLAGMMVISDSMMKQKTDDTNIDQETLNRKNIEWINETMTPAMLAADEELSKLNEKGIERQISSFDLLIDSSDIEKKKDNIKEKVIGYDIVTEYEMNIDIEFFVEEVEVLGRPAIIDGSFDISVNDGEEQVASGIISGEGYGILDIKYIGFGNKKYRVMCYSPNGSLIKGKEYTVNLKPKHLWYVENRSII